MKTRTTEREAKRLEKEKKSHHDHSAPLGWPRNLVPSRSSDVAPRAVMAYWRNSLSSLEMCWLECGDVQLVEVRILVMLVLLRMLRTIPRGAPSCVKDLESRMHLGVG
jgi:hypothetical protein